jgi:hypothetical protein
VRNKKIKVQAVCLTVLLVIGILFFGMQHLVNSTSEPVVYVSPSTIQGIMPPKNFTIKVNVANVTNLYGLDVEFTWNPNITKYVSHNADIPVETYPGGVLHSPIIPVEDKVDESGKMVGPAPGTRYWLSYASLAPAEVFNGSGTIFNMTFNVVGLGTSPLLILACTLADQNGNLIPCDVQNATFTNQAPIHGKPIAPANLTVSPSSIANPSLTPGNSFTVNVNAQVDRLYAFTFSLGYDATVLNATTVTGNSTFPPATVTKTTGQVKVSSSLVSPSPPINGSLSLASIKFNILATGTSLLSLRNVLLSMSNGSALPIHSIINGTFSNIPQKPSGKAKMFLSPTNKNDTQLGDIFTWNIDIANATGMYDYEFTLSYKPNVLLCLGAIVIPPTNDTNFDAGEIVNDTLGVLSVKVQYYSPASPINTIGNQTVVTITFMVKGHGQTPLTMSNADISNLTGGSLNPVVKGGNFTSGGRAVAILAIKVTGESYDGINYMPALPVKMYPGRILHISVVPMNNGTFNTETFNVTLHANSTVIGTQTVTLAPQTNTTLTFSWNTTGLIPGENFTLWAQASTVPGQTNTTHNILYDGSVFIKLLGDVNGDRVINIADVTAISHAYGTHPGSPNWNPEADIALPYGLISILDIVTCTRYFKITY